MDLLVGATGLLGSEICRRLVERNRQVRALVRSTSDRVRVEQLRGHGAEIVVGDLRDPASLAAACRGVQAVISTATAMLRPDTITDVDEHGQLALVDAARAARVEQFVFVSTRDCLGDDVPLGHAKLAVEQRLHDGGMAHTVLRPTFFMDVWLSSMVGFDTANARAQVYGSGTNPISWIALGDVAELAAKAVETPAARNSTFELGGPEALSPLEVVRIFEDVGGRRFDVTHVSEADLRTQLAAATDPKQRSFLALALVYAQGDAVDTSAAAAAFPFPLTSVREHARQALLTVPVA